MVRSRSSSAMTSSKRVLSEDSCSRARSSTTGWSPRRAAIANAFGCEVYAYSRTRKELPGVCYVDLDTLFSTCDVVSLHLPQTEQTKGMVDARLIGLMKPEAVLINTARGPIVDSAALADALKAGRIAGAGVDVFEMEPPVPSDHVLFNAPNLIATPHVAFASHQAFEKRAVIVCENIRKWLDGQPQNVI